MMGKQCKVHWAHTIMCSMSLARDVKRRAANTACMLLLTRDEIGLTVCSACNCMSQTLTTRCVRQ